MKEADHKIKLTSSSLLSSSSSNQKRSNSAAEVSNIDFLDFII
jgi:hypothetical protein